MSISIGSPLRCSTWRQSIAGLSMSCMCMTKMREFGICFTQICNLHTPKTASINIGSPIVENFSACQKVLRHTCSPTVRTHVFSAFHHGHGALHHVSGATGATVRSTSLRSSLLRAVCLHPLADTSRWSLGFKRTHFLSIHKCQFSPKNMSADMLKKSAHLTVLGIVPTASSEANTEHGIYHIS